MALTEQQKQRLDTLLSGGQQSLNPFQQYLVTKMREIRSDSEKISTSLRDLEKLLVDGQRNFDAAQAAFSAYARDVLEWDRSLEGWGQVAPGIVPEQVDNVRLIGDKKGT